MRRTQDPSNESGIGTGGKWMGTWEANAEESYFGLLPHHREQSVSMRRTQDCRGQGQDDLLVM